MRFPPAALLASPLSLALVCQPVLACRNAMAEPPVTVTQAAEAAPPELLLPALALTLAAGASAFLLWRLTRAGVA
jgi:hypothetical protein